MRIFFAKLLLICTVLFPITLFAQTYTFGLVPQQSASKLAKIWTPIFTYLGEQTGDTYLFSTAKDIPTFEQRVSDGQYDFAYMNPYHFTVFSQQPGYEAFLKQKNKRIQGIFVSNKHSNISRLEDLNNQTIAFPSPAAFAASIILQAQLNKQGINFTPVYVSSHDSVYLNVQAKNFPAGGGIKRTLNNTAPTTKEDIKILWESPKYTPHAFAAHPRVEPSAVSKLQQAFLDMQHTEQGKTLLKAINIPEFEQAQSEDWDDVRALNIQLLDHLLNL